MTKETLIHIIIGEISAIVALGIWNFLIHERLTQMERYVKRLREDRWSLSGHVNAVRQLRRRRKSMV